jgi:chemotaxis methyl-accepting protein methylase
MDSVASPSRFRHVTFTAPTCGRLRSTHAIFSSLDLSDELAFLPYDEETFLRSIFLQAGLDIRAYRLETLKRRIPPCLRALRSPSLDRARRLIRQKSGLLKIALNTLLIGVTSFFRDAALFNSLPTHLQALAANASQRNTPLRIWSAGCSDGAELYSIAILLAESNLLQPGVELLGTDCRVDALTVARAGCYTADIIDGISPDRLQNYFHPDQNQWIIHDSLRRTARWRTGDLLSLIEPGQWDVILCRNVAMYFRSEISRRLMANLAQSLRPGGLLILGKAERPDSAEVVSPLTSCLFRRDRG